MHKDFYASGFLYHPPTQQILLKQESPNGDSLLWSLFSGGGAQEEEAEVTFQRVIYRLLHIRLSLSTISQVYDYFCTQIHKKHRIVYAEVKKLEDFSNNSAVSCSWFPCKQISKLTLSEQTKHDLVVSQRVIDAKYRKSQGERTL